MGASGKRVVKILADYGLTREDIHITNTILCHPHKNMDSELWQAAIACCKPRLVKELGQDRVIIAAGNWAMYATLGITKIMKWMGAPQQSPYGIVIPSIHPAFALRKPAYLPVLKTFFGRAIAFVRGQLTPWQWPAIIAKGPYAPHLEQLMSAPEISVDIENVPDSDIIRCIGVGTESIAVSVPLPPEGDATEEDLRALRNLLGSSVVKILQNGQHDRLELSRKGWPIMGPFWDTMLAHAVCAPRLPHNLGFLGAVETHAPRWKTLFHIEGEDKGSRYRQKRFEQAPLPDLLDYNAKDNIIQATLKSKLQIRLDETHNGQALFDQLQRLDDISLMMRKRGIYVDQSKFAHHRHVLQTEMAHLQAEFRKLVPSEDYTLGKIGTHPSLGKLFFNYLKAPIHQRSELTGEPTLNGAALQHYVGYYAARSENVPASIARIVLRYRKLGKLMSSYIESLEIDKEDGSVHPIWRVFGARTGRWSATEPAIQTIPKANEKLGLIGMRDLFAAHPGLVLVEGDYSQLELRIVALLSGDEKLLAWYADDVDVHTLNAQSIWGAKWATMGPKEQKQARDLAKRVVYGMNYGGSAETIWGALIVDFPAVQVKTIRYVMDQWFKQHPKIAAWQQASIKRAQQLGYVEAPLSGRRQYYHDREVIPTEVLNYPIQATAGDLANRAVEAVAKLVDWKETFLLAQVHDSLVLEGPDPHALAKILHSAMEQEVELNGARVKFPIDVKFGTSWGDMKKV